MLPFKLAVAVMLGLNTPLSVASSCLILSGVVVCSKEIASELDVALVLLTIGVAAKLAAIDIAVLRILAACRLRLTMLASVTSVLLVMLALAANATCAAISIEPLRLATAVMLGLNTPLKLAPLDLTMPGLAATATVTTKAAAP